MIISQKYFKPIETNIQENLCVLIMPFDEDWSQDMFEFYEKVMKENGFSIWRSDMEFNDDQVMQTLWKKMVTCKFIIADCTNRNSNVFYELGLAHALGKSVLITTQERDHIPFDLKSIRYYNYNTRVSGLNKLSNNINNYTINIKS